MQELYRVAREHMQQHAASTDEKECSARREGLQGIAMDNVDGQSLRPHLALADDPSDPSTSKEWATTSRPASLDGQPFDPPRRGGVSEDAPENVSQGIEGEPIPGLVEQRLQALDESGPPGPLVHTAFLDALLDSRALRSPHCEGEQAKAFRAQVRRIHH